MITAIIPKLPMRNKIRTKDFYLNQLGFETFGREDYDGYLMVQVNGLQIHFFDHPTLDPKENYGQVYIRTNRIEALYQRFLAHQVAIHVAGHLQRKPWGQLEFSLLDPDNNLLTFGQDAIE